MFPTSKNKKYLRESNSTCIIGSSGHATKRMKMNRLTMM